MKTLLISLVITIASCTRPDYDLDYNGNICPAGETWFGCSWTIGGGVFQDSCGNTYVRDPYQSFGWQCCKTKAQCDAAALQQLQMGAFGQDVSVSCYDTGEQDRRKASAQAEDYINFTSENPPRRPQGEDGASSGGCQ